MFVLRRTLVIPTIANGAMSVFVEAVDVAGNAASSGVNVSWIQDTTPPDTFANITTMTTAVVAGPVLPAIAITTPYLLLSVGSDEAVSGYFVRVWKPVQTTAVSYAGPTSLSRTYVATSDGVVNVTDVLPGDVRIDVGAVDLADNKDATPVELSLVIVPSVPDVVVTALPPGLTNHTVVNFNVTSPNGVAGVIARFGVTVTLAPRDVNVTAISQAFVSATDSRGTVEVNQSVPLSGLSGGDYGVSVYAVDVLGRIGVSANVTFTVDVDPPTSVFVGVLPQYTHETSVDVVVSANDSQSNASALVRLNGAAWVAVVSDGAMAAVAVSGRWAWSNLVDGDHVVEVMAMDSAGNVQPPPYASESFVVDTIAPIVSVASTADGSLVSVWVSSSVRRRCVFISAGLADESIVVLPLRTDPSVHVGHDASPCSDLVTVDGSTVSLSDTDTSHCGVTAGLSEGNHTVMAMAIDAAGNPSLPSSTWVVVDTIAPSHTTSQHRDAARYCTAGTVLVCNSASAAVFEVGCSGESTSHTVSPCKVQYLLRMYDQSTSACASSVNGSDSLQVCWRQCFVEKCCGKTWFRDIQLPRCSFRCFGLQWCGLFVQQWRDVVDGVVNATASVAAFVATSAISRFLLTTVAIDGAGNRDSARIFDWYVDVAQPAAPIILGGPDP